MINKTSACVFNTAIIVSKPNRNCNKFNKMKRLDNKSESFDIIPDIFSNSVKDLLYT